MPDPTKDRHDTRQAPRMRGHLDSDGHKTPGSTLLTCLVITLGMALALILAALHLGGS